MQRVNNVIAHWLRNCLQGASTVSKPEDGGDFMYLELVMEKSPQHEELVWDTVKGVVIVLQHPTQLYGSV